MRDEQPVIPTSIKVLVPLLALLFLKGFGVINWPWVLVFIPVWGPPLAIGAFVLLAAVFSFIGYLNK